MKLLLELFLIFAKIGMFTFGGGYAMISIIENICVEQKKWISHDEMMNLTIIAESTPGPIAINAATFVGYKQAGIPGSIVATVGMALPSFVIILIVAKCYDRFRNSSVVKGCMTGLKPAVVGLIAGAILSVVGDVFFPAGLGLAVFSTVSFYLSAVIFGVMLVLALKKLHPIIIISLSAVAGIVIGYLGLW